MSSILIELRRTLRRLVREPGFSGTAVATLAVLAVPTFHAPLRAQEAVALARGTALVTGRVIAADTRGPVPSVWIELLSASDSVEIGTAMADAGGRFRIERVPEGMFFVRLSSVGWATATTEAFEVAVAEVRALGDLLVSADAVELAPILVSAERTVVTYEADRTSYNIGVMPGTEGASVTQTLATIPELEVDIDGRVTLRENAVGIYIDGREAPMSGEALAMFLEQFPADYLQKIEVLDNPSARYDAEGAGGIVNLVTREGVELGVSGSVFANAGTRGQYGLGGRGTYQRDEWTVNGGGFARLTDSENTGYDLRHNLRVDPAYLRQDSWSDQDGLSTNLDAGVEYAPSERSRIFLKGRVSGSGDDSRGLTSTTHLEALDAPILTYERARSSDGRDLSFDLSTGFGREWESHEQQLEIALELQRGSQRENSREEITDEHDVDEDDLLPAELTLEDEEAIETEVSLQVDYARAWGKGGEIELGYVAEWTGSDNGRLIRLIDEPLGMPEGELTDRGYEQRESAHSVYTTLERRFGDLSVEAGLRAETLDRRFELPGGGSFGDTFTNLFPSANLSYRIDNDRQLRLSYSRRVERPGMSVLNPIDASTDPLNRRIGNPDTEPQFTHSLTAHASWSLPVGRLRLSPYYQTGRNGWAEITTVDDQGVSTRTYQNLASSESYGASLSYSLRRGNGWRGNISLSAGRQHRDASNLDARYSSSSLRLSSRANVTGRISEDLSAEGNFSYQPPTDLPQGRRDARYGLDLGMRHQMMDDRASVRLSLRDPFGLRGSSSRLRDHDYILIGRSEDSSRSAQISITYALGGGGGEQEP